MTASPAELTLMLYEGAIKFCNIAKMCIRDSLTDVYRQCVNGATDHLNESDRNTILTNLQKLREQVYAEGNADYAGRTVFTGYKTNKSLTFGEDTSDTSYNICLLYTSRCV